MSDRSSAALFGEIFGLLADEVPSGKKRDRLARHFWAKSRDYDFSDSQMEADDALIALGLAHKGVDPDYPEDGETTIYEPPPKGERTSEASPSDPVGLRIEQRSAYARGILRGLGCDALYGPCACGADHNDELRQGTNDAKACGCIGGPIEHQPLCADRRSELLRLRALLIMAYRNEAMVTDRIWRSQVERALPRLRASETGSEAP